jgi:hypothetical protein
MEQSKETGRGGGAPLIGMVALFAMIVLCVAFFVGCGSGGSDSVSYGGGDNSYATVSPTAAATVPFQKEQPDFLTSDEKAGNGLAVGYIAAINSNIYYRSKKGRSSLKSPAEVVIGLVGGVLTAITNNFVVSHKPNPDFNYVTTELCSINGELQQLNNGIASIQKQLAITQVEIISYIGNQNTQNYLDAIDNGYSGSLHNLVNFSQYAAYYQPSPAPTPTITLSFPIATPTAIPSPPVITNPASLADVQSWIPGYSSDMLDTTKGMAAAINNIATEINQNGLLTNFVNTQILNPQPTSSPTSSPTPFSTPNPNLGSCAQGSKVLGAYLLLESYFLKLHCEQIKALAIMQNCDLYDNDPTGSAFDAYMAGPFKTEFQGEVASFNEATKYLLQNVIDYRTQGQFNGDINYLSQGIASDTVYFQTLARAHFVSAILLDSFGYGNNGGLYGNITTPLNYTSTGNSLIQAAPTPLINLSGSPGLSPLNQKAAGYVSIFPYPSWNTTAATPTVSGDNNWAVFDLYSTGLATGTYTLTLNDGGSSITPWNHTSNQLGSVTVQNYYPNGKVATPSASPSPNATTTIKFGFFSGRWNFGNLVFSNSPFSYWHVSGDGFQLPEYTRTYSNPALWENISGLNPQTYSKNDDYYNYLYPYNGNTPAPGLICKMGSYSNTFSDPSHAVWLTGYRIYFPFIVNTGPGNLTPLPPPGTVNASYIYNATGGFQIIQTDNNPSGPSNFDLNYGVYAEDSKTSDKMYMVNATDFGTSLNWQGVNKNTTGTGYEIDLKSTCYYSNGYTGTYSQNLQWYVQFLYNGFVNIFN